MIIIERHVDFEKLFFILSYPTALSSFNSFIIFNISSTSVSNNKKEYSVEGKIEDDNVLGCWGAELLEFQCVSANVIPMLTKYEVILFNVLDKFVSLGSESNGEQ